MVLLVDKTKRIVALFFPSGKGLLKKREDFFVPAWCSGRKPGGPTGSLPRRTARMYAYSPMGAPQWGQNLESLILPQTGHTVPAAAVSGAPSPCPRLACSWAIFS